MQKILQVHRWPIWLAQLFGQGKSFTANPLIGSALLNRLGLHVLRVLLARASSWLRWQQLRGLASAEERQRFGRDGYLVIEDFLSPQQLQAIRDELQLLADGELPHPPRQMTQGDTLTQRLLLDDSNLAQLPQVHAAVSSRAFQRRIQYCAGKLYRPLVYLQRIRNGFSQGRPDPQKTLHSDTFFPAVKAWLFLQDVSAEQGPFTYIPGSQRLSWKRLQWEYRKSIVGARLHDGYSEKGSLRADAADQAHMQLARPLSLTARAGTLVIANTVGFHGRGQAQAGASRLEIWAYSRHNPFNPLPGISSRLLHRLHNAWMQRDWRKKDQKAARRNGRASWYPIQLRDMFDGLDD